MLPTSTSACFPIQQLPAELGREIFRRLPANSRSVTVLVNKWFKEMTIQAAQSVERHRVAAFFEAVAKKLGISLTSTMAAVCNAETLNLLRNGLKTQKELVLESLKTLSDQDLVAVDLDSLLPLGDPDNPDYIPNCPFSKNFFKVAECCRKAHAYAKATANLQDDQNDLILQAAQELTLLGEEDIAIKLCTTYYPDDANLQSLKLKTLTELLLDPIVHHRELDAAVLQGGMKIIDACYKIVASIRNFETKCMALQTHLFFAYMNKVRLYLSNGTPLLAAAEVERMQTILETFFPNVAADVADEIQGRLMPFVLLGYIRIGQVDRAITHVEQIPAEKFELKFSLVHLIMIELRRLNLAGEMVRVMSGFASNLTHKKDLILADIVNSMCCCMEIPTLPSNEVIEAIASVVALIECPDRRLATKFGPFARFVVRNAYYYIKEKKTPEAAITLLDSWFTELQNEDLATSKVIDAVSLCCGVAQVYAEAGAIDKAFNFYRHLNHLNDIQFYKIYKSAQRMVLSLLERKGAEAILSALDRYRQTLQAESLQGQIFSFAALQQYLQFSAKLDDSSEELDNISPAITPNDHQDMIRSKILIHTHKLIHWGRKEEIPQLLAKHFEGLSQSMKDMIRVLVIIQILDKSHYPSHSDQSLEQTLTFVMEQLFHTITLPNLKLAAYMQSIAETTREIAIRRIRANNAQGAIDLLNNYFENAPPNFTANRSEAFGLVGTFALEYCQAGRLDLALRLHRNLRPTTYPGEDMIKERSEKLVHYIYSLFGYWRVNQVAFSYKTILQPHSGVGTTCLQILQKWSLHLLYFYGTL